MDKEAFKQAQMGDPKLNFIRQRVELSCDSCQRTIQKGRVTIVPLGKLPLIDTPFKRVAVDIVGPIEPRS